MRLFVPVSDQLCAIEHLSLKLPKSAMTQVSSQNISGEKKQTNKKALSGDITFTWLNRVILLSSSSFESSQSVCVCFHLKGR